MPKSPLKPVTSDDWLNQVKSSYEYKKLAKASDCDFLEHTHYKIAENSGLFARAIQGLSQQVKREINDYKHAASITSKYGLDAEPAVIHQHVLQLEKNYRSAVTTFGGSLLYNPKQIREQHRQLSQAETDLNTYRSKNHAFKAFKLKVLNTYYNRRERKAIEHADSARATVRTC